MFSVFSSYKEHIAWANALLVESASRIKYPDPSVAYVVWINDDVKNRNWRKWKGRRRRWDRYKSRPVAAVWLFKRASLSTRERGRGDGVCRSQPETPRRRRRWRWDSHYLANESSCELRFRCGRGLLLKDGEGSDVSFSMSSSELMVIDLSRNW